MLTVRIYFWELVPDFYIMFPIMSLKLCHLLFNDRAALKATCRVFLKRYYGKKKKKNVLGIWFFKKMKWKCNKVIMLLGNKSQR